MEIAVHHDDNGLIIIEVTHNHRDFVEASQLTGAFAPMPGYNLIAVFRRPGDDGHQHAIRLYAFHGFHHAVIVQHAKRMVFEGVQFSQGNPLNVLLLP